MYIHTYAAVYTRNTVNPPQASCLMHSDLNFRGRLQVSMQSMADALAGGGKGPVTLPKGMPEVVDLQRFKDKSWFNQLLGMAGVRWLRFM